MKNKIIYLLKYYLFNRSLFATILLIGCCFIIKAQSGINDPTFDPGTGANSPVWTIATQSNNKIIIGGEFTSYNGATIKYITRLNTDGIPDATFNSGTGANYKVWKTAIQSNDKIIIGGYFTSYNGTTRNDIARLNADGTLDPTFDPGTGADDWVVTISIQSDGKIIIGGYFTTYNGTSRNCIARLNADGTLDAAFNPGTGPNNWVQTTAIQSDGKIIIGGAFSSYNGITTNCIARLNDNGTLDATFNPGTGANGFVETTAIQNDGKIIIGGYFTSYNGTMINRIARLNTDGTIDATFNPGTGANGSVETTVIQNDGKIIIGGDFTSYNGTTMNRIARINTDGTLDADFNPGLGANGKVLTTTIQSDGKIIIGGEFTSYNGIDRNRIARILISDNGISFIQPNKILIYPNPVSKELNIETKGSAEGLDCEIFNIFGQMVYKGKLFEKTTIQTTDFLPGIYMLKVGTDKTYEIKKIIKE